MHSVQKYAGILVVGGVLLAPTVAFAAGLVPCGGPGEPACNFSYVIVLAQNVINFLIFNLAMPLAAISFAVAGIMMLTAGGNESQVAKAKGIFSAVFIGLIIALSAWLIVKMIVLSLVNTSNFNPSPYIGP